LVPVISTNSVFQKSGVGSPKIEMTRRRGPRGYSANQREIGLEIKAMKTVYRRATLDDTNRLFELRRQSIVKLAVKAMSIEEAARWADNLTVAGMERRICELKIWVAEIGERVVGWGSIRDDQLEGLYVDPEFTGRGIGTELLGPLEGLMQNEVFQQCARNQARMRKRFTFDADTNESA